MISDIELIKMILEHIVRLHEAGIVATANKVAEEKFEFEQKLIEKNYDEAEIELADYKIANVSFHISKFLESFLISPNFFGAMEKNNKRLDWMKENPDPTKTPVGLWEEAKRAEKDGESEHE